MYLAKQLTSRSLPEIGRKFGNRDHTTVMHAVTRVAELMDTRLRLCRGCRTAAPDAGIVKAGAAAGDPAMSGVMLPARLCAMNSGLLDWQADSRRKPARRASPRNDAMKLKADRATLLKALAHVQSVVEKRNTIPILANVMIAVRDGHADADRHRHGNRRRRGGGRGRRSRNGACTAPAATLYEIVRKLPEGAEVELDHPGGDAPARAARRPLRHQPGGAADRGLPLHDRGHAAAPLQPVGAAAARPDRPHPLRHQHRGNPLLPQRHLPPRRRERRREGAARGRHRRPSPRPRRGAAARRRRLDARRHRPAQDRQRAAQAARRGQRRCGDRAVRHPHPVHRRHRAADQQADRRHLPRIRTGHPARQRQGAARGQEGLRRRGRAASPRSRPNARAR